MEQRHWHSLSEAALLAALNSSHDGLDAADADQRLQQFGANRLPDGARRSAPRRLLAQFHNVLIYVLIAAALIAALVGHAVDALVIAAVVLVNALIGFVQEGKAEQAMAAIGRMVPQRARVRRGGVWHTLPAEALVPGDVVELRAGDRAPADLRLLESHGLHMDEAPLTGESAPVLKDGQCQPAETPLAERSGMAYSGTMVTAGQALGWVCTTGLQTEIGRISRALADVEQLNTPLLRQMDIFARKLTGIILLLAGLVVLVGAWRHGLPWSEGFLAGVALAVAAIPEGLPAIMTITLAVGVRRMGARHAIIRRLPAVETLGAVSVICSDKTGTLTRNELEAREVVQGDGRVPAGAGVSPALLQAAVLCNDADAAGGGEPLEAALVRLAVGAGVDVAALRRQQPRQALLPFSSERKFMASLHPGRICLKGAPERLLARCSTVWDGAAPQALDARHWAEQIEVLAVAGMRVLAIAERPVDGAQAALTEADVAGDLCLLGLVGFEDPPRPEVPAAVRACREAGIDVTMITGDHAATAAAIAEQLDLGGDGTVVSGPQLDEMDEATLRDTVDRVRVYARTTPEHKLLLVRAMQDRGRVVAMTGDGANDAPALKRADIGVAMGIKGTEAARQAAEMVLADDNFATIVSGVEEGRGVYDNIRKALLFILPTNAAQAMVVLLAVLAGLTLPVTPVQILWINMAVAVTLALSLAFEPLEAAVMRRPPRPSSEGLLTPLIGLRIFTVGLLLTLGTFTVFVWTMETYQDLALARTMALNLLVAGQISYLFNARRWSGSSCSREALFANPWAWASVGVLTLMQLVLTYLPAAHAVFGTTALSPGQWGIILGFALLLFVLVELEKALLRRRRAAAGAR